METIGGMSLGDHCTDACTKFKCTKGNLKNPCSDSFQRVESYDISKREASFGGLSRINVFNALSLSNLSLHFLIPSPSTFIFLLFLPFLIISLIIPQFTALRTPVLCHCLSLCLSMSFCFRLCLSFYLSLFLPACLSVCLSFCPLYCRSFFPFLPSSSFARVLYNEWSAAVYVV